MGYGDDLLWIRDAEQQGHVVKPTRKTAPKPHKANEGLWKHLAFVQPIGEPLDELQHKDGRWHVGISLMDGHLLRLQHQ